MTEALTYAALNAPFLGAAALVALSAVLARRTPLWRAAGLAALGVLILTAVFDNVLVGTGIVGYDAAKISGAFVGIAPIEDFAYAVAAVILLPSLWHLLAPRPPRVAQIAPSQEPIRDRTGHLDAGGGEGGST